MIEGDEVEFAALRRVIERGAGMVLDAYKDKCLRRRIAVRMRACGVHTYSDYATLLGRDSGEVERLTDALTINVTRFYRNRETWDALRTLVLPGLMAQRQGQVRVWSAGCASGEEPYTVAMLCGEAADAARRPEWLERVTIDATDIDRQSLDRARTARYRGDALDELPEALVERWFHRVDGGVEVTERARRCVRVARLDLFLDPPLRPAYDLILCRNVVIYFDKPMQERLFSRFADALAPGGHLVLGKVETLVGAARERLSIVDPRERIYRRTA